MLEPVEHLRQKMLCLTIVVLMTLVKVTGVFLQIGNMVKKVFGSRKNIIEARRTYGFKIKFVLSTWATSEEIMQAQRHLIFNLEGSKEMFLCPEWELVKDTVSKM